MTQHIPAALTIAGSDSSGGAGIQADLKTFSAFGVYGASAITALTAQNTTGVTGVHAVPADFVVAQIDAVLADLEIGAIKTGMLANAAIVTAVSRRLEAAREIPVVVDPVMVATSGANLLDADAIDAVRRQLIPRATLITPNLPEAARLLGEGEASSEDAMARQAVALQAIGAKAVLIKGGHGTGPLAVDLLAVADRLLTLRRPRIETSSTHGTGCTLSAAVTALLAAGACLENAVDRAKTFVWNALDSGRDLGLGAGHGPVDHLYSIRRFPPPV